MEGNRKEEKTVFEIAVVVPKRDVKQGDDEGFDCIEVLVDEFKKAGLIVDKVSGFQHDFIKLAAPLEIMGSAAAKLHLRKKTHIGLDLAFEWDKAEAFVKQPDGSLFSWCERFRCYHHIICGTVNKSKTFISLSSDGKVLHWESGESLLQKLETEGIVKDVFPLHDEIKRKQLLRSWALNFWDFTRQPIDEILLYFGSKIATYFAFLGMYTQWMLFPAALGLALQLFDFGALQLLVFPAFLISIISWAALLFQFWKRKNAALLARWQLSSSIGADPENEFLKMELNSESSVELSKKLTHDKPKAKKQLQKQEWFCCIMRFRNDTIMILSIICLQLPFELAYAHLSEAIASNLMKFGLTAIYLLTIRYFTKIGGKISVNLTEKESIESIEYRANSLIYKVFGLYFMQSYIGLFYHMFLHRNFLTLRQVLIQRLIVSQVLENLVENTWPYLQYSYRKYRTFRKKRKHEKGSSMVKAKTIPRVEKEYLKPTYSASICEEFEDGVFDDFLELAVQFGTIMMFACALPSSFTLAILNNITEIRTDALKMLAMYKRPVPRAAATIGAWLNIFQFLIVMSICTNCALLVCLYHQHGKWKIGPGLAAILIMEHVLLLIKFIFSRVIPQEPAWVKADRVQNAMKAQEVCSKELLQGIFKDAEKTVTSASGKSRGQCVESGSIMS